MKKISIGNMDEYMKSLSINVRNEKIREFFRFKDNKQYFKLDTNEEIKEAKNIWAGYAYLILIEKIEGKELTQREEKFLNEYFLDYVFNVKSVGFEEEVKSLYLKYRMSRNFEYNKAINPDTNMRSEIYKKGLEEFQLTIKLLFTQIYTDEREQYNTYKDKKLKVEFSSISSAYMNYIQGNYDIKYILNLVKEVSVKMENAKFSEIKSNEISARAIVYTVEDYLEIKARQKNTYGFDYSNLYRNLISNKQLAIDSMNESYKEISKLKGLLLKSTYLSIDKQIKKYVNKYKKDISQMEHYKINPKYFDVNEVEMDAMSKLFKLYVNSLKASPKSRMNAVSKYLVVNGEPLSVLEMNSIVRTYKAKYMREKNEEKKLKLEKKLNEVTEVFNFVKRQSYVYLLEQVIINANFPKDKMVVDLVVEHYGDYLDMKYKLKHLYESLDRIASSGSSTKVSNVLNRADSIVEILKKCEWIDSQISANPEMFDKVTTYNEKNDIIISKLRNYNRVIAILQEFTGKGIITCKDLVSDSIENGTPVIRNLDEGFKEFIDTTLVKKGVSRKKSNKKTK